jgi:hypothetical protein
MKMCGQVFYGWSTYEVDGVYLKTLSDVEKAKLEPGQVIFDEERTQVLRLMFKFEDEEGEKMAYDAGHPEVYRAILSFVLGEYAHTDNYLIWDDKEFNRFVSRQSFWNEEKIAFAKLLYKRLAPAMAKWIVDCGLFIFGYLVREFWKEIVELNQRFNRPLEDEIWVASIFHLTINVMKPQLKEKDEAC